MEDRINTIKIPLMMGGVQISNDLISELNAKFGKLYNDDYVTNTGIMLILESAKEPIYVTVHLNANSDFVLASKKDSISSEDSYELIYKGKFLSKVKIWAPAKYLSENIVIGNLKITDFVNSHFDRIRVSPIGGCTINCAFCSCREIPYTIKSIEAMDKAIDIALQDNRITHALISGGTPKVEDLQYLSDVYEHICKKYPIDVDVMMMPREFESFTNDSKYAEYVKWLKDVGVKGLSVNIELFNDDIRKKSIVEANTI